MDIITNKRMTPTPTPRKGKEMNDKKTKNGGQIAAELNKT